MARISNIEKTYKNLLGPVIYKFIYKLDQYINYLDDGETVFLYATRAGYRIKKLYEIYKNTKLPKHHHLFLTSRFLVAKSYLTKKPHIVSSLLIREYKFKTVDEFIKGVLRFDKSVDIENFLVKEYQEIPAVEFIENFSKDVHSDLYDYLNKENNKYENYFTSLIGNKKRVVIIDSGWSGTIQKKLSKLYPEIEFFGLYFGKILPSNPDWPVLQRMKGLMFENMEADNFNVFSEDNLNTIFNVHRHIIEDLFEPSFSTIEYIDDDFKQTLKNLNDKEDERFKGVLSYFNEQNSGKSLFAIEQDSHKALKILKEKILYPKKDDIEIFGNIERSFDFGKNGTIKVLLEPKNRYNADSKEQRIKDSIWSQGQIYLEYANRTEEFITKKQESFLTTYKLSEPKPPFELDNAKVAIITRTMDREILLKRACNSVESQTFKDYNWVIVNDAGDIEPVLRVARNAIIDPMKIVIVNNLENIGMEAASNRAIKAVDSKYIVIHDDDDSWHVDFLKKTVSFLESSQGLKYGAVITDTMYVSEEIRGSHVIIHEHKPYNDWIQNIHITEMAHGNMFAPIAFLFKREIYDKIGGFDESLPVLGDWDFNLRYLMEKDIGVLKEPLAYYHHRDRGNASATYSNSVIGGISKHMEYAAIVRNKFIRNNNYALATIISNGFIHQDMRSRFDGVHSGIFEQSKHINDELHKSIGWLRNEIINEIRSIYGK